MKLPILKDFTPIIKLNKDAALNILKHGAMPLGNSGEEVPEGFTPSLNDARLLVDLYYSTQEQRKRLTNQIGAMERGADEGEHDAALYMLAQMNALEANAKYFLEVVAENHVMSPWFEAVHGIGPVLSAGIIANLGVRPVPPTVGHWWRYAGLDPSVNWMSEKELKARWNALSGDVEQRTRVLALEVGRDPETVLRDATTDFRTKETGKPLTQAKALKSLRRKPWNGSLKTLCWKVVDQMVKLGDRPDALYAKFYRQRKAEEIIRNERGGRRHNAKKVLVERPNHAQKAIYQQGKLPDGHIDAIARRATAKMFLSHLHELWYELENDAAPPKPFSISIQGHGHYIAPFYAEAVKYKKS